MNFSFSILKKLFLYKKKCILVEGLLVILISSMIFLPPFLDVTLQKIALRQYFSKNSTPGKETAICKVRLHGYFCRTIIFDNFPEWQLLTDSCKGFFVLKFCVVTLSLCIMCANF